MSAESYSGEKLKRELQETLEDFQKKVHLGTGPDEALTGPPTTPILAFARKHGGGGDNHGITAVLIPLRKDDGTLEIKTGYLQTKDVHEGNLSYTAREIIEQAFELLNAPYGWGGMYGEQDCSAFLQEVFKTVGIYLPRNSQAQAKVGKFLDELENILFSLELADGTKGYGEAAIASHITGETIPETTKNLKSMGESLVGRDPSNYLQISAELHEKISHNKSALAAIETALLDALTRQWNIPLWKFFGPKTRPFSTDITIVIADLEETEESVKRFYKQGFRAFKVKIGRDFDLDIKRVLAVHRLAPLCAIYLDGNQGYSAGQTLKFVQTLRRFKVCPRLIEQPVAKDDWEGLKKVTRLGRTIVCADESVRSISECIRAIREKAVHAVNIKLMKTGIFHSREIALLAKAAGIKLMIGGMMETSLAMMASAHLAAGMGGFDYIDLDTPFFIKPGFDRNPYLSRRGVYDLRKIKAGVGIIPRHG